MVACCKIPNHLLRLLDYLIVCMFISPLVVFYWQGTWVLMDIYILPASILDSALISTSLGVIFSLFILSAQRWIVEKLSNYHSIYLQIAWKMCIYLTSISSISFWRGVWMLMDMFAGVTLTVFLVSHGIAFILLTATRTTSSLVSCPGFFLKDQKTTPSSSFNFDTISLINCIKSKSIKICLSHFLTVFVIGTFVALYWRGTWNICLHVANMSVGTGLSTCIATCTFGYVASLFCFLISQPIKRTLTENFIPWPYWIKASLEHMFVYVLGFASVGVWSGIWCLGDYFFIIPGKENSHLSALLMHCISFLALFLAQGSINLVGAPAGCRTHGSDTLEGFFMGTYFIFTDPYETESRVEVTSSSNPADKENNGNCKENHQTQTEPNMNESENNGNTIQFESNLNESDGNATQTERNVDIIDRNQTHVQGNVIGDEGNTQSPPNLNDAEINASHTKPTVIESDVIKEESNATEENEHFERDVTEKKDSAKDTATEVIDSDNTVVPDSNVDK